MAIALDALLAHVAGRRVDVAGRGLEHDNEHVVVSVEVLEKARSDCHCVAGSDSDTLLVAHEGELSADTQKAVAHLYKKNTKL